MTEPLSSALKQQIDSWSYQELLAKWRFTPIGSPLFQGVVGDYVQKRMLELERAGADHVAASKAVGWEP